MVTHSAQSDKYGMLTLETKLWIVRVFNGVRFSLSRVAAPAAP
jgi:hypothetical protein